MTLENFKRDLIYAFSLAGTSSLITCLFTVASGYLLTQTSLNNRTIIFISLFIFICGSSIWNYVTEAQFKDTCQKISQAYLTHAWKKLIQLPYHLSSPLNSAEMHKILRDYEGAIASLTHKSFSILSNAILLLLLFAYLFYSQPILALIFLFVGLLLFSAKILLSTIISKQAKTHLDDATRADLFISESLAQIHKIKTSNTESRILQRWLQLLSKAKSSLIKSIRLEIHIWLIDMSSFAILILTTLAYHAPSSFLICACQLALSYEKLSTDFLTLYTIKIAFKRLAPFLDANNKPAVASHKHHIFQGEIHLSNVTFNTLNNINIQLESGSFAALTGTSGSGKSTLFKLILGLIPNYTGTILFDKRDIRELDMQSMRKNIGVVLQTSNIFPGTIFSNICINTQLTLDEVWNLVRLVGFDNEVNAMPMKLFTYISDTPGDSISGGQKQKILIARALATKPKILFLDEATSALDDASQAHIFNNLQALNITRFVIAHRLNTIEKADKIYYLDNGHVIMVNKKA